MAADGGQGHPEGEGGAASLNVSAAASGVLAGGGGFVLILLAGWLLHQRLWPDSAVALAVVVVLFGGAGAFAGWLVGMIVFSAVRDHGERTPSG